MFSVTSLVSGQQGFLIIHVYISLICYTFSYGFSSIVPAITRFSCWYVLREHSAYVGTLRWPHSGKKEFSVRLSVKSKCNDWRGVQTQNTSQSLINYMCIHLRNARERYAYFRLDNRQENSRKACFRFVGEGEIFFSLLHRITKTGSIWMHDQWGKEMLQRTGVRKQYSS